MLKQIVAIVAVSVSLAANAEHDTSPSHQGIAGETVLSMTVEEFSTLAYGYSAKKMILGKPVFNGIDKKSIGVVRDLIITPEKSVSYAIVDVGGFLRLGSKHVAIRAGSFKMENGKVILANATKEQLVAMQEFRYSR